MEHLTITEWRLEIIFKTSFFKIYFNIRNKDLQIGLKIKEISRICKDIIKVRLYPSPKIRREYSF